MDQENFEFELTSFSPMAATLCAHGFASQEVLSAQGVAVSWAYPEGGSGNRKLEGTCREGELLLASTWDTHSHRSHGSPRGKTVTLV